MGKTEIGQLKSSDDNYSGEQILHLMPGKPPSTEAESRCSSVLFYLVVISARVWRTNCKRDGTDCKTNNNFKHLVVNVASQLEHAIKLAGLLKDMGSRYRICDEEATFEILPRRGN